MKKTILITIFSIGLIFIAENTSALTISPPVKELVATKGTEISDVVKLINEEDVEKILSTSIEGFRAKGERGEPEFFQTNDKSQLATWITLDQTSVTLKPGEEKEIKYTIKVPENAPVGGQYAAIFWISKSAGNNTGVGLVARTGALVLVTVSGEIKEEMHIVDFSTSSKFYDRLPVKFSYTFENTGSVHLKPKGNIKINPKIFGIGRGEIKINDIEGNILPESIRRFDTTWAKDILTERNTKKGFFEEAKEEWNNFAIGYFKADLLAVFGQNDPKYIEKTYTFWVIPWRIILVGLILSAIIILIFITGIKIYRDIKCKNISRF